MMKLICETIESAKFITEATENGGKNYYITGTFMQGGIPNKNGRIYPVELLQREAHRYVTEKINHNRAYGELNHPAGPTINLERASHLIVSLKQEGNDFIGKAKITSTPMGMIVRNLLDDGANLGVSSRGMGSLKEVHGLMEVQDDFHLATPADIVADPSAPNAFVNGIMEGREWVWNNGILQEVEIKAMKERVEQSVRQRRSDEEIVKIFEQFIKSL